MKDNKHSQLATSFQAFRHRLMMYMWPRMTTHTYSATKHEHKAHPRTYAWKDAWIQRKQFHSCFSLFCSPSVNPLSIIKEKSKDLIQFNELWGIQHSITQTSTFHLVHSDSRTRACIKPQISSGSSHQAPLLPFWALAAESQGASLLRTDVWATVWQLWATCEQQFAHRRVSNSVTVVSDVWQFAHRRVSNSLLAQQPDNYFLQLRWGRLFADQHTGTSEPRTLCLAWSARCWLVEFDLADEAHAWSHASCKSLDDIMISCKVVSANLTWTPPT